MLSMRRYRFERPKLGIMASGRGSNMHAILKAIRRGNLPAEIVVVVSDKPDAGVLDIARKNNIHGHSVSGINKHSRDGVIADIMKRHEADIVVLAGYNKLVREPLLRQYADRIINIHPAPLPEFGGKGMHQEAAHQAVLDSGRKMSGPTVHLVNEEYDKGKILDYVEVPVEAGDTAETLAARVLPAEHDLYWRVIRRHFCK